jgi:hypothetical protein
MFGNNNKCAPFYYQKWLEKGKPCVHHGNLFFSFTYNSDQGIFLLDVVSATLTTHFSSISSLGPLDRSSANPVGALVLSLQAVCISYLALCTPLNNSLTRSNRCYCTGRQGIRISPVDPKVTSPRTIGFNTLRGEMVAMPLLISLTSWSRSLTDSSQSSGA